jgi:hypothetical protein
MMNMTKNLSTTVALFFALFLQSCGHSFYDKPLCQLRAPAYPLVTIDPYMSAWSMGDTLYQSSVKHWTGKDFPLVGVIKVDGTPYRFMGIEDEDYVALAPNTNVGAWKSRYTTSQPTAGWTAPDYDDAAWKTGYGAFGTQDKSEAHTLWTTENIWVRRIVNLDHLDLTDKDLYLNYSHDDDAEIYINGKEVVNTGNTYGENQMIQLDERTRSLLKPGNNVIAAHCRNRVKGGMIDISLLLKNRNNGLLGRTATQKSVDLQPTQTIYRFGCGPVDLKIKFTAPLLLNNLELVARPVNYLSYEVRSRDGSKHRVELYLEASPQWSVNAIGQPTVTETFSKDGIHYVKCGSTNQNVLGTKGDNVHIDWGYFYLCTPGDHVNYNVDNTTKLRTQFLKGSFVSTVTKGGQQRGSLVKELGEVSKASGYFMLGYDDGYAIEYFGQALRPYWNRSGKETFFSQARKAQADYDRLMERCDSFDRQLVKETRSLGGNSYAALCTAAYRQAISGNKLVQDTHGELLYLSKENSSNGSIGTVDIAYPSAPLFLVYNDNLVKGMLNPIFYYTESGKYDKPYAPHDVGTYPIANGITYQDEMPIEECGNMLLLTAAVTKRDRNARYAAKHWDALTLWAHYLAENGMDPTNQLCTDDFAGHLAHNVNLSVKAILGIAAYGYMAGMKGDRTTCEHYMSTARAMAKRWMTMADDHDHYRLAFDKPGTWSLKYNLVWDQLMGWNLFPRTVFTKELNYYLKKQNTFGVPLDNRETYTKTDWVMWTAAMADDRATFEAFVNPIYHFMNVTTDRVPMTDWMYTDHARFNIFKARTVVGGYFMKLLMDKTKE